MLRPNFSSLTVRRAAVGACVGISSALAAVMPVLLTTGLGASYFEASLFMVAGALASSVAVYVLGRSSDVPRWRYPIAEASAACGALGALVLSLVTGYWAYLLVFVSLLAVAGSLFPQLMAVAIVNDKGSTPTIRSIASGGWVVGPPVGGLILSMTSPAAVFLSIAAAYAALLVVIRAMVSLFEAPVRDAADQPCGR